MPISTVIEKSNGFIDLGGPGDWGTHSKTSHYNTQTTQMKQSELLIMQTPDSLKLGTSSFGGKQSTV